MVGYLGSGSGFGLAMQLVKIKDLICVNIEA